MSDTKLDIGSEPAFPIFPPAEYDMLHPGLTKREWFAGMALQGMCAHFGGHSPDDLAADALRRSDAMIERLKETQNS